jgi:hypothetical protein
MFEKQKFLIRVLDSGNTDWDEIYNDFASNINIELGWSDRIGRRHPEIKVSKDGRTWTEIGKVGGKIQIEELFPE